MKTPKHIKYLSIIFFLNAGVALFIGGLTFFSMFYSALTGGENLNNLSAALTRVIMDFGLNILITILAVALLIFLGISLRKLKPWARTVTLVYSLITIFLGLLSLLTGDSNFSYQFAVQIYAVWVLSRPDVKKAFGQERKRENVPPSSHDG